MLTQVIKDFGLVRADVAKKGMPKSLPPSAGLEVL